MIHITNYTMMYMSVYANYKIRKLINSDAVYLNHKLLLKNGRIHLCYN